MALLRYWQRMKKIKSNTLKGRGNGCGLLSYKDKIFYES